MERWLDNWELGSFMNLILRLFINDFLEGFSKLMTAQLLGFYETRKVGAGAGKEYNSEALPNSFFNVSHEIAALYNVLEGLRILRLM